MATVYKAKLKFVSPFINYSENELTTILEKILKEYKSKENGLGFEAIEIDVEKLK
jgi:hypothetical protein